MNRMPIGQYIPGDSLIHHLDARVKLIAFILLISTIILTDSVPGYCSLMVLTAGLLFVSKVKLKTALGFIQSLFLFLMVIFVMNTLFFDSAQPICSWWIFHISLGGMAQGANVVLRVIFLMIFSSVLMATTAPMEAAFALKSLLRPLQYIRIPTEDLAIMISVAVQFIPVLMEETEMIRKAQTARGAKFESARLREKAASVMPLVIPIFLGAFRRADELSLAMEARGYRGGKNRTQNKQKPLRKQDILALLTAAAVCFIQAYAF
ncbi:MAG: energy-coupling factor transporter transmembrane protein EcfT [Peptococcaceae bacterium]|nr:energy-coupling factor transporter transmembrane protein EcfT [Peptococcaceae bacterium]